MHTKLNVIATIYWEFSMKNNLLFSWICLQPQNLNKQKMHFSAVIIND